MPCPSSDHTAQIIPLFGDRLSPLPRPEQPEVVAALLMLLEDAPLHPPTAYAARDLAGVSFVAVRHAGVTLRVTPDDAKLAADALEAEQAFPGCVGFAAVIRGAALRAEALGRCGRTHGRTGLQTVAAFAAIVAAVLLLGAVDRVFA